MLIHFYLVFPMKIFKLLTLVALLPIFAVLHAQNNVQRKDMVLSDSDLNKIRLSIPSKMPVDAKSRKVLVFSRAAGSRHIGGIPSANAMFKILGERFKNFDFTFSEDLSYFQSLESLKKFDCVVLNNTTGNFFGEHSSVLKGMDKKEREKIEARDELCQKNLIEYVNSGGGVFAIHAAVDSYKKNEAMRKLMGGVFTGHPWMSARILIEDTNNPILKDIWTEGCFDVKTEIYQVGDGYDRNTCRVLMRLDFANSPLLDEKAKSRVKRTDDDFAVAWVSRHGKGRYVYSTFGHNKNVFTIPQLNEFNLRALLYACGDLSIEESPSGADSAPKMSAAFKKFLEQRKHENK